jgi:hypothetical protein
LTQRKSSA